MGVTENRHVPDPVRPVLRHELQVYSRHLADAGIIGGSMATSKRAATLEEVLAAIEAARDKVMADEIKSLTKLGIPKAMAYQMIASRFHQKVGNQEEAEPDPFEGNQTTSWEEIS